MFTKLVIISLEIFCILSAEALELNKDTLYPMVEPSNDTLSIKLPWSECTNINEMLEEKLSFSEKQIKKENKIYKKYEKYYLEHNNPTSFFEDELALKAGRNFSDKREYNHKPHSPDIHFKRQEQFMNQMNDTNNKIIYQKIHHKKRPEETIYFPVFKSK